MKALKLSILFALLLGFTNIFAQEQKIAYVDIDQVLQAMPDLEAQKARLETFSKQYESILKEKEQELEVMVQEFEQNAENWTNAQIDKKRQEIIDYGTQLQEYEQKAKMDLIVKLEELEQAYLIKIQQAVNEISIAEGYSMVIPKGAVLYSNGENDITSMVIGRIQQQNGLSMQ